MAITIESLSQQIITLTEQVDKLEAFVYMASQEHNSQPNKETKEPKPKKLKKEKKEKTDTDHDKPKKVSGYILFSKANRDDAIETIRGTSDDDSKIKSTDVMKELGRMWKELEPDAKEQWNAKAKATVQSN